MQTVKDCNKIFQSADLTLVAQKLIDQGYAIIPIYKFTLKSNSETKYEKQPGYLGSEGFQKIDSNIAKWQDLYNRDKYIMFRNCVGLGLIATKPGNDNCYINRLDIDTPDINVHKEVERLFKDRKVIRHKTISGHFAVLFKSTEPQANLAPVKMNGEGIGHGSWWFLLPESDLDFSDLEIISDTELLELGFSVRSIKTADASVGLLDKNDPHWGSPGEPPITPPNLVALEDDNSDHELRRWKNNLDLLAIGFRFKLTYAPLFTGDDFGYTDDYDPWIKLLLICRSLISDYPKNAEAFRQAFIDFSLAVRPNQDQDALETKIDEELNREDTGELTIATLEEMIKTVKTRLYGATETSEIKEAKLQWEKIDPSEFFVFEQAFSFYPYDLEKEDDVLTQYATKHHKRLRYVLEDYEYWKTRKIKYSSNTSPLPDFEVTNEDLANILKKLPGTKTLVDYSEKVGYETALMLLPYLVNMRVSVPKKYVRFDFNGKEVKNGFFALYVGKTGLAKSAYTDVAALFQDWNEAIDLDNETARASHKAEMLKFRKQLKAFEKSENGEPPIEPPNLVVKPYWSTSDFTYQGITRDMRNTDYGMLLHLDEASIILGVDNSGQKADSNQVLARFTSLHNGKALTESKVGRDTVGCATLSLSLLGGVQPGYLKRYLKNDDSNFFGRCHLISMPEMIEEQPSSITIKNVQKSLSATLLQIREVFSTVLEESCFSTDPQIMGIYSSNETSYPGSDQVTQYLKQIYQFMRVAKGQRAKYLVKVRENFWRIVHALEIAYRGTNTAFEWEDLYNDAIKISKWLIQEYETVLIQIQNHRDEDVDEISQKEDWQNKILDFYRDIKRSEETFNCFQTNRAKQAKKKLGNNWRSILQGWAEELASEGKLQPKNKSYVTA